MTQLAGYPFHNRYGNYSQGYPQPKFVKHDGYNPPNRIGFHNRYGNYSQGNAKRKLNKHGGYNPPNRIGLQTDSHPQNYQQPPANGQPQNGKPFLCEHYFFFVSHHERQMQNWSYALNMLVIICFKYALHMDDMF